MKFQSKNCKLLLEKRFKFLEHNFQLQLVWTSLCENDLDFAGLNHAMFDWLKNYVSANQNAVMLSMIRFHENIGLVLKLASPQTSQDTSQQSFSKGVCHN